MPTTLRSLTGADWASICLSSGLNKPLYRRKSISEVLDDLGLAVPDAQTPFVSKSAAAQARQRLGPEPLKWLFEYSVQHWSSQDRRAYLFKGLTLFAMDGTTLRTHDNVEAVNISEHKFIPVVPSRAIHRYVV